MSKHKHDAQPEPAEQPATPEETMVTDADVAQATPPSPTEQDLIDDLRRLQAEFDNYRKRVEREQQEMKAAASDKLLRDLLPIIDNLQLSVQHAKDGEGAVKGDELLTGIIMINEQLKGTLEHYGITEIPDGGRFDPHLHEALTIIPQDGAERGSVLQTYQRGYLKGGKVFRPAKVSVAK